MTCPLCSTDLDLKQINFDTAIYICTNLKCPYPVGCQCIKVQRNLGKYMSGNDTKQLPSTSPFSSKQVNTSNESAVNDQIMNDLEQIFNMLNSD